MELFIETSIMANSEVMYNVKGEMVTMTQGKKISTISCSL